MYRMGPGSGGRKTRGARPISRTRRRTHVFGGTTNYFKT